MFKPSDYIVYYDIREDKGTRGLRLIEFCKKEKLDFTILPKRLDYGDYQIIKKATNQSTLFGGENNQVIFVVEYKTAEDFYSSLIPTRKVINQCIDCKNAYGTAFLIIEGDLVDFVLRNNYIQDKDMTIRQLLGARNTINYNHARVIEAKTEALAFWNLCNTIKKVCDGKDRNHKHVSIADNDYEYAFSCLDLIRDIGTTRTKQIMDGCNITHFEDIHNISYDQLIGIDGINATLANKVIRRIKKGAVV